MMTTNQLSFAVLLLASYFLVASAKDGSSNSRHLLKSPTILSRLFSEPTSDDDLLEPSETLKLAAEAVKAGEMVKFADREKLELVSQLVDLCEQHEERCQNWDDMMANYTSLESELSVFGEESNVLYCALNCKFEQLESCSKRLDRIVGETVGEKLNTEEQRYLLGLVSELETRKESSGSSKLGQLGVVNAVKRPELKREKGRPKIGGKTELEFSKAIEEPCKRLQSELSGINREFLTASLYLPFITCKPETKHWLAALNNCQNILANLEAYRKLEALISG